MWRQFWRDERGDAVIETVLMVPVLAAAWIGAFAFWESFDSRSSVQKAAFTAADILSREMVPVTDATLNGLDTVMEYMVGDRFEVSSRFTSFTRTGVTDADVAVVWSYSPSGAMTVLTTDDLKLRASKLPKLAPGMTALLVDTTMEYSLPVTVPFINYVVPSSFTDYVVLRPRFVPKLCRFGVNC